MKSHQTNGVAFVIALLSAMGTVYAVSRDYVTKAELAPMIKFMEYRFDRLEKRMDAYGFPEAPSDTREAR
jgi:hypothetical protein